MDKKLQVLIQKCVNKDREGQREIYTLLSPVMYGICLKYMKSKVEAEDVFQDAFVLLFQNIHQFKFKGSFEGWAKRIFINKALEVLRKKSRQLTVAIDDANDYEAVEDFGYEELNISKDDLLSHIQQLPDNYRIIFNLYVFEDYTHKEIAEQLNMAEGTSKSLLSRAKSLLRVKIKQELSKKVS